jgi:hypothetical protein
MQMVISFTPMSLRAPERCAAISPPPPRLLRRYAPRNDGGEIDCGACSERKQGSLASMERPYQDCFELLRQPRKDNKEGELAKTRGIFLRGFRPSQRQNGYYVPGLG